MRRLRYAAFSRRSRPLDRLSPLHEISSKSRSRRTLCVRTEAETGTQGNAMRPVMDSLPTLPWRYQTASIASPVGSGYGDKCGTCRLCWDVPGNTVTYLRH